MCYAQISAVHYKLQVWIYTRNHEHFWKLKIALLHQIWQQQKLSLKLAVFDTLKQWIWLFSDSTYMTHLAVLTIFSMIFIPKNLGFTNLRKIHAILLFKSSVSTNSSFWEEIILAACTVYVCSSFHFYQNSFFVCECVRVIINLNKIKNFPITYVYLWPNQHTHAQITIAIHTLDNIFFFFFFVSYHEFLPFQIRFVFVFLFVFFVCSCGFFFISF